MRISTLLALPKVLIFIFLSLDLQDRQKTVYDIPVMTYLKNPWTVQSWLLGLRDTCSPFGNEELKRDSEIQKG